MNHVGSDQLGIIEIAHRSEKKFFTLVEVKALLPVVRKVTEKIAAQVEVLLKQLDSIDLDNTLLIEKTENEANRLIEEWHQKMAKLGVRAKGLWYVDFDNGSNYFCWKYPESDIFFEHSYSDGFTGRTLIDKSGPLPVEIKECLNGENEKDSILIKNRSRTNKLTPWRV